jgi:hypothetical protein
MPEILQNHSRRGIKGPAPCYCPYCGYKGESNTFLTQEQIEYAKSIVMRKVTDAFHKDLKSLEFDHKPHGMFAIGLSLKVKASAPLPIRQYREKELETAVVCDSCTLRYAINGVFGWCPDCGAHSSGEKSQRRRIREKPVHAILGAGVNYTDKSFQDFVAEPLAVIRAPAAR